MSDPAKQVSVRKTVPLPSSANFSCPSEVQDVPDSENPNSSESTEFISNKLDGCTLEKITPVMVNSYISAHPEVVKQYLQDMTFSELEHILEMKKCPKKDSISNVQPTSSIIPIRYLDQNVVKGQNKLISLLESKIDNLQFWYEVLNIISNVTASDGCSLYVLSCGKTELNLYLRSKDGTYTLKQWGPITSGATVSAHVATTGVAVLIPDLLSEYYKYSRGTGVERDNTVSVLCVPIALPSSDIIGVMEFTKDFDKPSFTETDLQTALAIITWTGICVYQSQANSLLTSQAEINDFLLEVSKLMFDDIVATDKLIEKIMTYTKDLVDADRCALFLIDTKTNELYSNLLDEGEVQNGIPCFTKKPGIRFSIDKGIAGHVAKTGEIINISDAYNDPRFNREVDIQTGYTTHNILCMPIISKSSVIGVVEMINKKGCTEIGFTKADESSFKMFSVYSAMALHYSKILSDLQLKKAQYQVAVEQMSYHLKCTDEEFESLINRPLLDSKDLPENIDSFEFYGPGWNEELLPYLFLYMCDRILDGSNIKVDRSKLCRFTLTVRKNYRPVSYHNWKHGFNVAHCCYCIANKLKVQENFSISTLRLFCLLVAALAHDVDHRGLNNTYYNKMNDPLATLYQSSIMEEHHYRHTVHILQQDGHNIFSELCETDYRQALDYVKRAILATDLSLHFPNQKRLAKLFSTNNEPIDFTNKQVYEDTLALAMTSADLCAVSKPWPTQMDSVKFVYEEFYMQGDVEKEKGLEVIPMMDRNREEEMPKDQVGFIQFVCIPCYQTLSDLIPATMPLLQACKDNLFNWNRILQGKNTNMWQPEKSRVDTNNDAQNKQ